MMNILFVIQGWERPSSRYRVLQYLPYLEKRGVVQDVITYPKDIGSYVRFYPEIKHYDVIFLQRKRPPFPFLQLVRRRSAGMVYDFDDAIMFRSSTASSPYSATRQRRFARTVEAADHVIAGNAFLREQARRYAEQVTVIPTAIDTARYTPKRYKKKEKVTIGWIGSSSTLPYVAHLKGVFDKLGKRYKHLELKIICDSFFDCDTIPVIKKMWREKEEIADLQSLDIGVMPLSDDPWSRGKCGLKILQYYGVGVPTVCTPVGVNRDVVQDGINGFWALTHEEWIEKISQLVEDSPLRQEMGMRGRELIERSFSVHACAPQLYKIIEEVAQRGNG
jgi:glycosyltransferase involved in cell wall biosynthesis